METDSTRVLLIDDNPDDAFLIRMKLAKASASRFSLEWAKSFEEGLDRLVRGEYDVVLLDLTLPDSVGFQTFARLHAHASGTPVVVLSGLEDEALAIKTVREGAQDYLVKGAVDSQLLERAICYAIERQRLLGRLEESTRELRASEARFLTLVERNADGIALVSGDGVVLYANPATQAIFGRSPDELVGHPFGYEVSADEVREIRIVSSDKEICVVEMRAVEVEMDGASASLVSLRDVSDRELLQLKDEFVASVSHELRTPLFAIRGFVDFLLKDQSVEPEIRQEFLSRVARNVQRLTNLVNDLLDISKLESAHLQLDFEELDLDALVVETLKQFQYLVQESNKSLVHVPAERPAVVVGDSRRILQVLYNLVGNAVKFSGPGSTIEVIVKDSGEEARVEVHDQGAGIPEAEIPKLFTRFYRGEHSLKSVSGGTGLGLYISKKIVDAHGGRIAVESTPGLGSAFIITLPKSAKRGLNDRSVEVGDGRARQVQSVR